jgi:hypothetical protein
MNARKYCDTVPFQHKKEDEGRCRALSRRFLSLLTVAFKARKGSSSRAVILVVTTCFLLHEMAYQGGFHAHRIQYNYPIRLKNVKKFTSTVLLMSFILVEDLPSWHH